MPVDLTRSSQVVPVERHAAVHRDAAAGIRQQFDRIDRQNALAPQRAVERRIAPALGRKIDRGRNRIIRDRFHAGVGESHGRIGGHRDPHRLQRVLESHQPKPDRPVPQVRAARFRDRVEIDVDDVVEHSHRNGHGALQPRVIQSAVMDVIEQIDRAKIADGGLVIGRIERDLGAEVRGVNDAGMTLRRTQIAGVLERDPGMPGLEQHGQHLAPEIRGADLLEHADFAARRLGFIGRVALGERLAIEVVQIGRLVRREQGPFAVSLDALHEQVRHPVRGVHVMGATAVVAGVLAQIEEFLDVDMPGLQIGADRALALAALVDGDRGVVGHF